MLRKTSIVGGGQEIQFPSGGQEIQFPGFHGEWPQARRSTQETLWHKHKNLVA